MKTKLALALALAAAPFASAAIIHVNMYASSGGNQNPQDAGLLDGPAGGLGETWNQFNTTTGSGLLDSTGATTTVGFTNNVGSGWAWANPDLELVKAGRAQFTKGADTTHTITGLTPGNLYDVWIASQISNDYDPEAGLGMWSTSNPTTTVGAQAIDNVTYLNNTAWEYGVNYVLFENVEADGGGEIILNGDAFGTPGDPNVDEDRRLALSGWQIEEVPEPSALALLGLGGLLMARRRK